MNAFVLEDKLSSSANEKITSAGLALLITAGLIFILWFLKITVPNPPFDVKQGVVILDIGLVDAGFGQPDQGGPSPDAPALGGPQGDDAGASQSGGYGDIVTNEANKAAATLPPIKPPTSTQPSVDPRLKNRMGKIGSRTGTGPGDPSGFPGGTGSTGSGPGGTKGGVTGNGGITPGGVGNGVFSYNFTHFKLSSTVTKVNADGEGNIVCRVSVDCAGRASVIEYGSRGTTYSGSVTNMKNVFDYFINRSTFTKIGDKCPESGLVTLTVKTTI
jgi:hypothetical protein